MLLPIKVNGPAALREIMVEWNIASISLGVQDDPDSETGYGVAVAVIINPKLAEAMEKAGEGNEVPEASMVAQQVLTATQKAVGDFFYGANRDNDDND